MLDIIKKRRSIRQFSEKPVSEGQIKALVAAALLGPSGKDKKSVELVVVQNKSTITALKDCKAPGNVPLTTAPLVIAVLSDAQLTDTWVEDASIATLLIQLQAEALGLGSTWVQMRLRQGVEGQDSETSVRKVLGIPAHYGVLSLVAIGHKAEERAPYTEADVNLAKVHMERFAG